MNDPVSYVILSGWLVTIANIIPMAGQWVIVPMAIIIMMVYQLITWFMKWYIFSEIRTMGFMRTIFIFILGILVYVGRCALILVYGWEYIGLISFLLISFWQRSDAIRSSISAVMYNRLGDFRILMFCYIMESWILGIIAILRKSALWIIRYWLPMAIERPTPVSSLLHSSTIVVARVILSMILRGSIVLGVTAVVIMSMFLPCWFDGKKIIALSTSVHLVVMFLSVSMGLYRVCLIHILTHAFVKATCFVASGVKIGITGNQELRWWNMEGQVVVMVISFLLLCGVGGSLVYNSKEIIVFQILLMIVVFIRWKYTKMFFNSVSRIRSNLMKMQYSLCIIFVIGGTGFGGIEMMIILIIIRGIIPILNSWSRYVVNK